jgi:hypothetical protein
MEDFCRPDESGQGIFRCSEDRRSALGCRPPVCELGHYAEGFLSSAILASKSFR